MPALSVLTNSGTFSRPQGSSRVQPERRTVVGRLCFGSAPSPTSRIEPPAVCPEALWSPPSESRQRRDRDGIDLSRIPGLFSDATIDSPGDAPRFVRATEEPGPAAPVTCCICLECIDPKGPSLSCPTCSMNAHPNCLGRWFGAAAAARRGGPTALPSSAASCPYCRAACAIMLSNGGDADFPGAQRGVRVGVVCRTPPRPNRFFARTARHAGSIGTRLRSTRG